jgi:hypothetical protein
MAESNPNRAILEQGDIYFFYRPRVNVDDAKGLEDVQRMHVVMHPHGKEEFRLLTIGRKRLPDVLEHERTWGFVEVIANTADAIEGKLRGGVYQTKTRGERREPPARPAGEGVYALVREGDDTYLAYELELPAHPGAVQQDLKIPPHASFALSVKNPEKPSPPGVGLKKEQEAEYPKELQKEFRGRRFAAEDERLLDYEGAEFILVGARLDPERELAIEFEGERETPDTADIFRELHLARSRLPTEPLFRGQWR